MAEQNEFTTRSPASSDDEIWNIFNYCSNTNRWGPDDELGTLNYITAANRLQAASLVREGFCISLGQDISTQASRKNPHPANWRTLYEQYSPLSALDYIGLEPHGFAVTHTDAVNHVFLNGKCYNGREASQISTASGLTAGSVYAQRDGIFTRGVFLDIAGYRGVPFLEDDEFVTIQDLDGAAEVAGVEVATGDTIIVYTGLEEREVQHGIEDPTRRCGLHAECLRWIHDHEVAVYSGDCVERMPYPSAAIPLPLHQIGLVSMGLCLLDCPRLAELRRVCEELKRCDFALSVAPLRVPNGTGSPVNPIAVF